MGKDEFPWNEAEDYWRKAYDEAATKDDKMRMFEASIYLRYIWVCRDYFMRVKKPSTRI